MRKLLFSALFGLSCVFSVQASDQNHDHHGHDHHGHAHVAPHGGTLIPLADGGGNLEILFNQQTGHLQIWLLDGCAENFIRSPQKELQLVIKRLDVSEATEGTDRSILRMPLAAIPNLLTGETIGNTSEFGIVNDALIGVSRFAGYIASINFQGTTLTKVPVTWQ